MVCGPAGGGNDQSIFGTIRTWLRGRGLAVNTSSSRQTSPRPQVRGRSVAQLAVPRRGELWLVLTPGQPDDPHQPRPALVVSDDIRNRMTDDLIVVPLFSRGRPGPTRVGLPAGAGGLDHESLAYCEQITTVDRDFLRRGPMGDRLIAGHIESVVLVIRRA